MKGDVKRKFSPWTRESEFFLSASSPCDSWKEVRDRASILHGSTATTSSFSSELCSRGAGKGRQPRFYRRLEAYGFMGLCEGA